MRRGDWLFRELEDKDIMVASRFLSLACQKTREVKKEMAKSKSTRIRMSLTSRGVTTQTKTGSSSPNSTWSTRLMYEFDDQEENSERNHWKVPKQKIHNNLVSTSCEGKRDSQTRPGARSRRDSEAEPPPARAKGCYCSTVTGVHCALRRWPQDQAVPDSKIFCKTVCKFTHWV